MKSLLTLSAFVSLLLTGCSAWNSVGMRSQSPDGSQPGHGGTRLVGDLAVPFGMHPVTVEAIGPVTGLRGTGSDPIPSSYRAMMMAELQRRDVREPNAFLRTSDTAIVTVRAVLPPGIQKGEPVDVAVLVPPRSETTSIRGGRLLETPLRQLSVLSDNRIHDGRTLALAGGPIMVDPCASEDGNPEWRKRGLILGGGRALRSRPLLLVLKPDHQSVWNASLIDTAVNRRFHSFDRGNKIGVATARDNEQIELTVHPRYKHNVQRYIRVVRAVALRESELQQLQRLEVLESQLLDPITTSRAALRLEAIGKPAIDVLKRGIRSDDPEVRFRCAEALAYLDVSEAAEPLGEAVRTQPAFRVFALTALGAMDDFSSLEILRELLNSQSAETRYGAFRALSTRAPNDPVVMGENLRGQFSYHVLDTQGADMVHVTRSRRPEVVLFGRDQRFRLPFAVDAGNQIMVVGRRGDEIAVSRFAVGEPDQQRVVSTDIDEVIRAIVELGGTYPDVVQALQEAKAAGALTSRFEVEALPEAGRTYDRVAKAGQEEAAVDDEKSGSGFFQWFSRRRGG